MKQMTAIELKQYIETNPIDTVLLDVREPWEFERCNITGSVHIPMGQIPSSLHQLDSSKETVVICHHGIRSYQVAYYLLRMGFSNVINLSGGVDAWARDVDQTMTIY